MLLNLLIEVEGLINKLKQHLMRSTLE